MKNFSTTNKINLLVCIIVSITIFLGYGFNFAYSIASSGYHLFCNIMAKKTYAIEFFTAEINERSSNSLSYHSQLINLNSFINKKLDINVIKKGTETLVKTDSDQLISIQEFVSDDDIDEVVNRINDVYLVSKKNNANFLFVGTPCKGYDFSLPQHITNYAPTNFDRFMNKLEIKKIPNINLVQQMKSEGIYSEEIFFKTDHHWTPETGFYANNTICLKLNDLYKFEFNPYYNDLNNYNKQIYKDWFLGAYGKKVGLYFTDSGADDITLITPKFSTNLTVEFPLKNKKTTGSFEETIIYKEHIETKDYFNLNPYAAYSGGDFRIQKILNNANPSGKKFVIIRDSYSCVVTPFLALNASELHLLDMRSFIPDKNINALEYINNIKPDYVIVILSGIYSIENSQCRYDFNN